MKNQRRYIGKWELGCMVFNTCVYKIFTAYPSRFNEISGSAGWITALFTGIVFITVLWSVLSILERLKVNDVFAVCKNKFGSGFEAFIRIIVAVYWLSSAIYALREFATVLRTVAYTNSPRMYLVFFLLAGAAVPAACGARAVYRMHSLLEASIAAVAAVIGILGFKYASLDYLTPIMGTGANAVFGKGLSTLFLYTDIIFVFFLFPYIRPEINKKKTILTGASSGAALNAILVLVFSLTQAYDIGGYNDIPMYPLTKSAYFGRFWSRTDAAYLVVLIMSAMLYLSLALHMISVCVKGIRLNKKTVTYSALCLVLCLVLSGCYDSRDVEEGAYIIALGIDKGKDEEFSYTFQLSNPLENGENSKKGEEEGEKEKKQTNKGVSNIDINSQDFYTAIDKLKGRIGKEPVMSHLRVICFSEAVAKEGLMSHSVLLCREREIRPDTKLCIAESANDFLVGVKPELEQSTVRYYELLFREESTPYAPITELRSFVSDAGNSVADGVIPVAKDNELVGMWGFKEGKAIAYGDSYAGLLYKLIEGEAHNVTINSENSAFSVTSYGKPEIKADDENIYVRKTLRADVIYGAAADSEMLARQLEKDIEKLLEDNAEAGVDIIGLHGGLRRTTNTEKEWKLQKSQMHLTQYNIKAEISIKIVGNAFNLQNN